MNAGPVRFTFCTSVALQEGRHLKLKMTFEGRPEECLVVRFAGKAYAYINRCVHMPRPLDCEQNMVFDQTGRYLRCSGLPDDIGGSCSGPRVLEKDGERPAAGFFLDAPEIGHSASA